MKTHETYLAPLVLLITLGLYPESIARARPGDLNEDHEVSLADVDGFNDCLAGPDIGTVDSVCLNGDLNSDGLVDLYDVAGFQRRFGFGVGPPQIDRFWPPPGEWIVDDIGLTHIEVGFSEPVIVPRDAVIVWLTSRGIGGNAVEEFTLHYDVESNVLTITFDPPLKDDRVTLVLDYLIEDLSGRPLDGEIHNPYEATFPSGDGYNGGQAVFRINVLQGDANRDGLVDKADSAVVSASLGLCDGAGGFDPDADLNGNGCVGADDTDIVDAALGRELTQLDGTRPRVTATYADGPFGAFDWLAFSISETIDVYKVTERSCFLLDSDENVIVPAYGSAGLFGDSIDFFFIPVYAHCNLFRINVSNAILDLSGEPLDLMSPCTCLVDCPEQGGGP